MNTTVVTVALRAEPLLEAPIFRSLEPGRSYEMDGSVRRCRVGMLVRCGDVCDALAGRQRAALVSDNIPPYTIRVHTIENRKKLIARVRRIRGQLEAVERALEGEAGCSEVLQTVTSARGALNGLVGELIEGHIRTHVIDGERATAPQREAAEELVQIVRTYVK